MSTDAPLSRWKPPVWATGQLAVQIYRDLPSLLLLFYMTQVLAVPPAMAGTAIFVPKLFWAAACDYTMGSWLDRVRGRFPRRILLLAGALLLPIALIAVFTPFPSDSPLVRSLYVSFCMAGYMTVFSIFSVPHLSIGAELGSNARDQSVVMGWRTVALGLGILLGAGAGPWIVQSYGGKAPGYRVMALTMAAICSVSLVIAYFGSAEAPTEPRPAATVGKWRALRENRPIVYLLFAFFALMMGQGIAMATYSYLVVFRLALDEPFKAMSISTLCCGGATIVFQPLLIRITARFGALQVFLVGSALYSASLFSIAYGPPGSATWFYIASFGLGLSNATILQSAYTRLSELVMEDRARGNTANASFYSSLFVASDKIAFGLGGTLLAGILLSLIGFVSGSQTQTPEALIGIARIYGLTPILFCALAIVLMYRSSAKREPEPALQQSGA